MYQICTSPNFVCDILLMFFSFSGKSFLLIRNFLPFPFIFASLTFFASA